MTSVRSLARRSTLVSHGWLALAATVAVSATALTQAPFDPDQYCCDHLYYRGQAEAWTGLGDASIDSVPLDNRFWGVLENRETYYQAANGLASQPPYVYRPLVPVVAGLLGHVTGLSTAFYVLSFLSLVVTGYLVGLTLLRLQTSVTLAAAAAAGFCLLPDVGQFNLYDYMLVDAASFMIVALVLYLVVTHQWRWAALVSGVIAPLTKETLIALGLCVAVAAFLAGVRSRWLWLLPVVPVVIQGLLRLLIHVPAPPSLGELYIPGDQIRPAVTLMTALVAVSFLFYGLAAAPVRHLLVSFTPLVLLLAVITSSSAADSPRIWLTIWPFVLVTGAAGLAFFLRSSPLRFAWVVLPVLAFVWLHFGNEFQQTNAIVFYFLDYALVLIPPALLVLEYLRRAYARVPRERAPVSVP